MFSDSSGTFSIPCLDDIAEQILNRIKLVLCAYLPFSAEAKSFISTVAGEAIGATTQEQKAVAHTIMNRVNEPRESWSSVESVSDVLQPQWYNAVGGSQYSKCMEYLNNRDYSSSAYERLIIAVMPIYYGFAPDFTNGAHFIFNANSSDGRRLLDALNSQPERYTECGPFEGVDPLPYCMYRCEY